MKPVLASILIFLCLQIGQAQLPQYHAQVFGAEQGLDAGGISLVFKDHQQFLWVVSDDVVQRFDGRNVHKHGFEKMVMQGFCDSDNRIWLLSGQKIWRSIADRWGFELMPLDTAEMGLPGAIFQLEGRPFCTLTKKGFFEWNEKSGRFQRLHTPLPPALSTLHYSRFDVCGTTVFYPGKDSMIAADLATGRAMSVPTPTIFSTFCAITPDLGVISYYDGHSVWVDFKKGTTAPIDAVRYGLSEKSRRMTLMDAVPLGDSVFLVTTRYGACSYDLRNDNFTRHRIFAEGKPIGLEEAMVRVFQDELGTFWAHNSTNVIAFSDVRNSIGLLRNYSDDPAQSWSNRIIGFTEDAEQNIWFGGFNGFNKLDTKTGRVEMHPPEEDATDRLSHISVRGMAFDGRYLILGPTLKGMWLYDPRSDRFRRPVFATDSVRAAIEREFVRGIVPLRDGNFFVCARHRSYLLDGKTYRLNFLEFPESIGELHAACQDSLGRIWIGSQQSIVVLDEQYRFLFRHAVEGGSLVSIFQRSKDEMLIGTNNGLMGLSPASAHGTWTRVDGPIDGHAVNTIYSDRRNRFWFGTDNGLFLADQQLRVFRRFDFADNIQSEYYYPFSVLRASSGLLFLGGRNGINYFYPENIEIDARPLSVTVQTLTIGDSVQWNPRSGLVLSHHQNTLQFGVVAPYFNNAGKLQYRYRLSEDGEWFPTGGSSVIRLVGLAPGSYRLEVAASIAGAQWYSAPPLEFRIRPAVWQTTAFIIGAVVAGLLALFFFVRHREKLLQKRQQQSLELERLKTTALQYELEAAEAKLQSLRLQMSPHFLFNALNSIQELILTGNSDGAAMYLSKFSKLLRMVLTHSDHDIVSLREEIGMLKLYLELESLRFYDTFEYAIECEPGIDQDEYKLPTLLIQPFVENAIWHGLLHKEGQRRLHIRFETDAEENLVCTVEDNGIGREAAHKTNGNGRHAGKGMSTGIERLQALNSRHHQQNALEIIDLTAADGTAAGTRVRIKLT